MAIQEKDVRISLLLSLALISCVANGAGHLAPHRLLTNLCTFDVTRHGVKAGAGQCKQNAVALTKVLVQTCQSVAPAMVLIPPRTFEMSPIVPGLLLKKLMVCKLLVEELSMDKAHVSGHPVDSIKFCKVTNTVISGFTSLNPLAFHMHVVGSTNFIAHSLTITAPDDSPNTDGNTDITISGIQCGPGHGISVGSLGKYKDEKNVNKVLVTDCKFIGTDNGARIKTWLNSPNLKATGITFQNLIMDMVKNPIVIDQEYGSKSPVPSNVLLSDIHFRKITGTSISDAAVNVVCSKKFPCCVDMANIDLVYKGTDN
ncbi:hypothetical protein EZV62_010372 [Acer yangbiense]|uniref:Pectate lyase superfamily protein domain-containing protein n=1 Tax=Acer yangbiense TaxID=1000413 RepID=A0A5C7I2Y6_9ROSI|nr:hypothetical protein EZV62_010372 [Acer yangbiense]